MVLRARTNVELYLINRFIVYYLPIYHAIYCFQLKFYHQPLMLISIQILGVVIVFSFRVALAPRKTNFNLSAEILASNKSALCRIASLAFSNVN